MVVLSVISFPWKYNIRALLRGTSCLSSHALIRPALDLKAALACPSTVKPGLMVFLHCLSPNPPLQFTNLFLMVVPPPHQELGMATSMPEQVHQVVPQARTMGPYQEIQQAQVTVKVVLQEAQVLEEVVAMMEL